MPTSGLPRPVILAIWASSCAICPKCPRFCAHSPTLGIPSSAGGSQLEGAQKHPDGSGQVINALAMAASYNPNPTQFLGIRLPVTFDTCEVIEERWANWLRQDPVVALERQAEQYPC